MTQHFENYLKKNKYFNLKEGEGCALKSTLVLGFSVPEERGKESGNINIELYGCSLINFNKS